VALVAPPPASSIDCGIGAARDVAHAARGVSLEMVEIWLTLPKCDVGNPDASAGEFDKTNPTPKGQ
jgi:hypothetical protein